MSTLDEELKLIMKLEIPKGYVVDFGRQSNPNALEYFLIVNRIIGIIAESLEQEKVYVDDNVEINAIIKKLQLYGTLQLSMGIKNLKFVKETIALLDDITLVSNEMLALEKLLLKLESPDEKTEPIDINTLGFVTLIKSGTLFSQEYSTGVRIFKDPLSPKELTVEALKALGNPNFDRTLVIASDVFCSNYPVLEGVTDKTITINTSFDKLEGVKAYDIYDSDITNKIIVTGIVDVYKEGNYLLYYSVTNSKNLTTSKKRVITVISSTKNISIYTGKYASFALLENGNLYAWGSNEKGQLNLNISIFFITMPTFIKSNIFSMSSSGFSTFIINKSKELFTCGNNIYGQLGQGYISESEPIDKIAENIEKAEIAHEVGYYIKNNKLMMWGDNRDGKVGVNNGTEAYVTTPTEVGILPSKIEILDSHVLAVDTSFNLYGWGYNGWNQVGGSSFVYSTTPFLLNSGFYSFSTNKYHSIYMSLGGVVWGSGYNQMGQVALDPVYNSSVLQMTKIYDLALDVKTGTYHTMILDVGGSVYTCGYNIDGQLGNGNFNETYILQNVLSNVREIFAFNNNSFAITIDGGLYGWGDNRYGILGNGTKTNSNLPLRILEKVVSFAYEETHVMALCEDGSIWTWGNNHFGQIGNGNREEQLIPYNVKFS